MNPHAYVYIDTVNENGETEVRWCEMQARTQLQRRGITLTSFELGGPITVSGFVSRHDPMGCEAGTMNLTDGQEIVFRHRDGQSVYGAPQIAGDQAILGSWYPEVFLAEAGSETDSIIELQRTRISTGLMITRHYPAALQVIFALGPHPDCLPRSAARIT